MSIRQISSSSAITGKKSNKAWDQSTYIGDYFQIASAVVDSAGASTITFSSIPQTFEHLQIRGILRSTATVTEDSTIWRFNSDSTANYRFHSLYGNGTAGFSSESGAGSTSIYGSLISGASSLTSTFGAVVFDVLNYANTNKYKTSRSLDGMDRNTAGFVGLKSGVWMSTSAISSISIAAGSGNLAQYSSLALYGVK